MSSEVCRVCGKPLFTEASIKRGIGPVCFSRIPKETEEESTQSGGSG